MPKMPVEHVARSLPFEHTSLDYLGPLYVKSFSNATEQNYKNMGVLIHLPYSTSSTPGVD